MEGVFKKLEVKALPNGVVSVEWELARPLKPDETPEIIDALVKEIEEKKKENDGRYITLSGAGPIWFYAMLLHKVIHKFLVVAIFDPKLNTYITVASHTPHYLEGQPFVPPH